MNGTIDVNELAAALAALGTHGTRAAPSTPSNPYYTGPGGLFGALGLSRDVISTRIQPMGLADRLPARGSLEMNPLFPFLTGFQANTGSNKDGVCDDAPIAGPGKSCVQTAQFGRYEFATRALEINRVGQQINRGEFQDLQLINDPLLQAGSMTTPNVGGNMQLRREMLMRMIEVGVSFQNALSRQLYEGNPANNTGGGGYREFPGLDILIGTGKVDAITGISCPSLDSDIKNFQYGRVDAGGSAASIVNVLSYMMRYLRWNADQMNLSPATWSIVMRPALFWELSAVWPCSYMTYRCQTTEGNQAIVDAGDMIEMRDGMRREKYLLIDGERYEVILDSTIREETNTNTASVVSGCFASDIYIVPRTVRSSFAATFWEFLDFTRGAMVGAADGHYANNDFWTDGGRYLWTKKPPTNWCTQLQAKIEPRVVLRTPQLAGRLQNVQYCPLQHERDVMNSDPYFVNGGVTAGYAAPSYYKEWTGN